MRVAIAVLAIASGLAIQALSPAYAWYDSWGRWHPNYYRLTTITTLTATTILILTVTHTAITGRTTTTHITTIGNY